MDSKTRSLKCGRIFLLNYLHHRALLYKNYLHHQAVLYKKKKDEPDDVNNFTKHFAHILNFEFYCLYYI